MPGVGAVNVGGLVQGGIHRGDGADEHDDVLADVFPHRAGHQHNVVDGFVLQPVGQAFQRDAQPAQKGVQHKAVGEEELEDKAHRDAADQAGKVQSTPEKLAALDLEAEDGGKEQGQRHLHHGTHHIIQAQLEGREAVVPGKDVDVVLEADKLALVVADVLVHAEAVVGAGGGVLGTVDRDGERHVGDIVGVVTGGLHLDDGPASQHHAADLAVVDHGLAALPVGGGGVFLGQTHGHGVIQDLVHGVGAGAVAAVREGILGLGHRDVHPVGIAGGAARNIGVPGGHGPAGGKVGVQGDGVGFVLDELQVGEELIGGLGQLGDAGSLKDSLIVNNALRVAGGGDAVDILAVGTVGSKVVFVLDLVQVAELVEVVAQLGQGDGGGDHADVAPVIAGQAGGHVLGIVGDAFVGDADVGLSFWNSAT